MTTISRILNTIRFWIFAIPAYIVAELMDGTLIRRKKGKK